VEEIEKQFSRLDEAVAGLKRAKVNLRRYKAAVLKAAVEGKLTEQWRKENPDVEPAEKLLERILAERRKKWEATELVKIKAEGRESKGEEWKTRYKEPEGPDPENLPAIPNSWTWTTLPQLGELNRGKSKYRRRNDPKLYGGPYPFIQTGDIRQANGVINKYKQIYSEEGLKQSRMWPKGTLCITIAANIANTAILGFDACFPDSVVGFIPSTEYTDVRFIEYFFRTAQKDIEKFAPATAQKNINLNILAKVAIPLPPEKEQRAIVEEIERRLSVAEKIERSIEANKVRTDHFRQSILKKAFSGRLVLQIKNQSPN
jgi:type I restriction enzyme S subunit